MHLRLDLMQTNLLISTENIVLVVDLVLVSKALYWPIVTTVIILKYWWDIAGHSWHLKG